jgi:hypothetical protein
MWACPQCFAHDGIELVDDDADCVRCHACGGRWRVDLGCWLRAEGGPARDMHIDAAYARIKDHFGVLPALDPARRESAGVMLEGEVELEHVHRARVEPVPLGRGHLQLLADRLRFVAHGSDEVVELPFEPVVAVLVQVGSRLQIRTAGANYQISPTAHSINMWKYFLDCHLREYRRVSA